MSGKKGRSGRKSRLEELDEGTLGKACKGHLLMRMHDPSTPIDIKDKISLIIAPRYITNEVNISLALPSHDVAVLAKYSIAIPDNRLALVTGKVEPVVDNVEIDLEKS